MAYIRVIHDPIGETLTVYWDDPEHEEVCEESARDHPDQRRTRRGDRLRALYFKSNTGSA